MRGLLDSATFQTNKKNPLVYSCIPEECKIPTVGNKSGRWDLNPGPLAPHAVMLARGAMSSCIHLLALQVYKIVLVDYWRKCTTREHLPLVDKCSWSSVFS